ncbi:MAG: HEAT repeat domain-containing protein [Limisphaerales bacterium]
MTPDPEIRTLEELWALEAEHPPTVGGPKQPAANPFPSRHRPLPSGDVTFMFTDIVGSISMKGEMPGATSAERQDAFLLTIKEPHNRIIRSFVAARGGVIVEGTGDGYFIAFSDAQHAVLCGLEIQDQIKQAAIPTPNKLPFSIRIGLHTGPATPTKSGYTASAADKAARVMSSAEGGQVFLSRETARLVEGNVRDLECSIVGEFKLKGIGEEPLYVAFRSGKNPVADIEDKYRQHLVDRFGKLTLYSLSSDQPIAVDLEQVFVKLTAQESPDRSGTELEAEIDELTERKERAIKEQDFEGAAAYRAKELAAKEHFALLMEASATPRRQDLGRYYTPPLPTQNLISFPEALRAHPHLAIIGAPGAGKTTALKWLALAYARRQVKERLALDEDRLPLFVTLRDFNRFLDCLEKDKGLHSPLPPALLAQHLQEYYAEHVQSLPLPPDFFLRALATGKALVLLDGLDEVAVASKRTRAAEFVAACVRTYPKCRFVLSSRPRGYENDCRTHLAALCSECRVRDFDDADIAAFSTNWYLAVTIAREGDNPTTRDRAASAAKNLQAAVKQERVRPLAANPLLLSILALIHQKGVGLPQRRVELYQECTEFLLGYWDQVKHGVTGLDLANLGGLTRQEKCALLEPIALWIHERGEKGTEVSRKELNTQLEKQFCERFAETETRAKVRAREFVDIIEQRAGLIVEREQDTFAFTHLTFQEYLAARALSDREDFVEQTLKYLHDPWWREVHLLEVAHLSSPNTRRSRADTQVLLTAIRGAESWLEGDLHRDLLFAFQSLCDVGQLGVNDSYRRELAEVVLKLFQTSQANPLKDCIQRLFSYAGVSPVGATLVEYLLPLTQSKADFTRLQAAEALGLLGAAGASPAGLHRLTLLTQDNNYGVQSTAIRALGRLGPSAASASVIDLFSSLLRSDDFSVKGTAIDALGLMGAAAAREDVLACLLTLISSKDIRLSNPAGIAFGRIARAVGNGMFLTKLLDLTNDPDDSLRGNAVCDLANLPPEAFTEQIVAQLLKLTSDKDDSVRLNATAGLSKLKHDQISDAVFSRLIELTQDNVDGVRSNAAGAIRQLSASDSMGLMLAKLLAITRSDDRVVLRRAIEVIGLVGTTAATEKVTVRLLELTRDNDPTVKEHAVTALGRLGPAAANGSVINRIAELVEDESTVLRWFATEALGKLCPKATNPKVVHCLLAGLDDKEEVVRNTAAEALGKLGTQAATPLVLNKLIEATKHGQGDIKWRAGMALGRMLAKLNKAQTEVLVQFCKSYMTSDKEAKVGREFRAVSEFAFDTLQRIAARLPRTADAEGQMAKARGKTGSRATQPKRAKRK